MITDDGAELEPVAVTQGANTILGERPTYPVGAGTVGRAYADNQVLRYDDVQSIDDGYDRKDARSGLYIPIGSHGTISINDTSAEAFGGADVRFAQILAANAEAAFDRIEHTRDLELYRTMVESVPDGVYALDEDLRYMAVNEGMVELTGYSKEELVGSHLSLVNDEAAVKSAAEQREGLWESEDDVMTVEHTHLTTDGDEIPCEVRFRPLNSEDEFQGTAGTIRDITERKARERELERYETIIEASGDAVYTIDAHGQITFVNDAFCTLVGYSEDDLLGEYVSIVMDDKDIKRGEELIRELLDTGKNRELFEMDLIRADGKRITCENHLALLPFEEAFRGTTGIHRDITERNHRERELKRQNELLEEFTSIVSHDLRNPINIMRSRLELASQEGERVNRDDLRETLDRMEQIVEDTLALAQSGRMIGEMEPVDLSRLSELSWQNVEMDGATPEFGALPTINADPERVRQLLENLFRNAVDHGGTNVTVTVGSLGNGFYIEDDGSGIPVEARGEIFDPGYSTTEEGLGIGLNIVKRIADAHDWGIAVTAGDHGGARFEITSIDFSE